MINEKDITIIIPHWGSSKEQEYALDQCLLSLKETAPDIRVSIAKNGEKCKHDGDVWVREQGQNRAVNATVATTNTEWFMVTMDYHVYAPGWFEKLVELIEGTDIRCMSPKLIEPIDGAPTFEKYFCGGAGGDFDKVKWLEFAKNYSPHGGEQWKCLRTGFNLPFLIKREVFDLISMYDVNYDPYGSNGDSDLEYKIRLAGVQPYQNTNCIVYHFSQTSGTSNPENRPYWAKNWDYFISKWGFPRTDNGIWEANFEIPKSPIRKFLPWWEGFYEKNNKG